MKVLPNIFQGKRSVKFEGAQISRSAAGAMWEWSLLQLLGLVYLKKRNLSRRLHYGTYL